MSPTELSHASAFELLPWLVNGRLNAEEREAVESHVRGCLVCRREIKDQRLLLAVLRSQAASQASVEGGFNALERRLDTELPVLHRVTRGHLPSLQTAMRLAAAVVVVLAAALLWTFRAPGDADQIYQTLATSPVDQTAQIDVIFAEDATAADIHEIMDAIAGEIVAGPTELGRYGVRVAAGSADAEAVGAALDRLHGDARVRFAGRAFSEPKP